MFLLEIIIKSNITLIEDKLTPKIKAAEIGTDEVLNNKNVNTYL